jgi:hypothetical protein
MMTLKILLTATVASILAASVCGAAYANDLGEDGAWQFKGAAQAQIDQQNLALIEARDRSTTQQQSTLGGGSSLGTATGLLSASNAPTNNFTQVVNETTISCAGAGTVCTATGGANTTSVTASSVGSTTPTPTTSPATRSRKRRTATMPPAITTIRS